MSVSDLVRDAVIAQLDEQAPSISNLVSQLVKIPSVSGAERDVAQFITSWGHDHGLEAFEVLVPSDLQSRVAGFDHEQNLENRPNVVLRLRSPRSSGRRVVINGHIDVVPTGNVDRWRSSPFSGEIREGRIYGRGSSDMKGGLAVGLTALRVLAEQSVQLPFDIEMQCAIGEETGGIGTIGMIDLFEEKPMAVFVLEPTACRLVRACGGAQPFSIKIQGRAAHISAPWNGVSAAKLACEVFAMLQKLGQSRQESIFHPLFDDLPEKAPLAIGVVQAGDWRLAIPDSAMIQGRIGTLPTESLEDVRQQLFEAVHEHSEADSWLRENPLELYWDGPGFPGWETPGESPPAVALASALTIVRNEVPMGAATYGCDAGHFFASGAPVVIYGPGDIAQAHVKNEFVSESQVHEAAKVISLALLALGETRAEPDAS